MTMQIEISGVRYQNFIGASCDLRLDSLSSRFEFIASDKQYQKLPFSIGDSCVVIVDDEPVLTGFIEVISVDYSAEKHTIRVQGRDKTCDLLDSSLSNIDDLNGQELSLKAIIEKVIDNIGADISVIDQVNPDKFSASEDIAAPEPGSNAFQFIQKYAKKRQVLLTSNADGNVVIASNSGITAAGRIQHIANADDNNVISSRFSYDITGRFNAYQISSSLNPVALNLAGDTSLESVVNQRNGISDNDIRAGRQKVIVSEIPFSNGACLDRAKWEANIRKARGLVYSAEVDGSRVGGNTGDLWQINRVYAVVDDFLGKQENMLCNSVTHSFSNQGTRTALSFVGKDAYTLLIEPDPVSAVAPNIDGLL